MYMSKGLSSSKESVFELIFGVEFQIPVKVNFTDFKVAFDSIQRESIGKIVESYGLPRKLINLKKNTYDGLASEGR